MNIFITSFIILEAVSHLDDIRLNKMILETAQLLSTAYRELFEDHRMIYKSTHFNHPCTIWARKNNNTFSWLVEYFNSLSQEKIRRDHFLKDKAKIFPHKSWEILHEIFDNRAIYINHNEIKMDFFDFNCTDFKNEKDIRISYQRHLTAKWDNDLRTPKWTGIDKPFFYQN
ncbi:MAG: pyrimidine dimer DNA glycosylase/endonuclease V [Anaplasmataceae bacterium]|nr:pyrimidine dimer DNA glycosylase/endonuclease V [Anaplasmataceae bacterium]